MHMPPRLTTGIRPLDLLLDQVRIGDNLVFITKSGAPGAWLLDRFVDAAEHDRLVIADAAGRHAGDAAAEVLDWSARNGAGDADTARAELAAADERIGAGALFAFDSLDQMAESWGDQAALDLFLWACPRLFRRGSIALWVVEQERHDESFVQRLSDITQVVVEVSPTVDARLQFKVTKADGRPVTALGRSVEATLDGGDLVDVGPMVPDQRRFGEMLRDLRVSRGVGQAELARRIDISPSALSQAERGVRTVSAATLMRIFDTLSTPLVDDLQARGFRVNRRSTQTVTTLANGVTGRRLAAAGATVWQLSVAARASSRQPLFAAKGIEVIAVTRGLLELEINGRGETLHEGDSLEAVAAAVTAWSNPADTPAEAIWLIVGSGNVGLGGQ